MAKTNPQKKQLTLSELIAHHRLNKVHLAEKMGMPVGTFKNKVLDSLPAYHLSAAEELKLVSILEELARDIKSVRLEQQ